jgi:hypothetical protein
MSRKLPIITLSTGKAAVFQQQRIAEELAFSRLTLFRLPVEIIIPSGNGEKIKATPDLT